MAGSNGATLDVVGEGTYCVTVQHPLGCIADQQCELVTDVSVVRSSRLFVAVAIGIRALEEEIRLVEIVVLICRCAGLQRIHDSRSLPCQKVHVHSHHRRKPSVVIRLHPINHIQKSVIVDIEYVHDPAPALLIVVIIGQLRGRPEGLSESSY